MASRNTAERCAVLAVRMASGDRAPLLLALGLVIIIFGAGFASLKQSDEPTTADMEAPSRWQATRAELSDLRPVSKARAKGTAIIVSSGTMHRWVRRVGAERIILCGPRHKRCPKRTTRARDAQALTAFAVANYDRMPRRVAFVHGHVESWHSRMARNATSFPARVQRALLFEQESSFIHLGLPRQGTEHWDKTGWCKNHWQPEALGRPCPTMLRTYQGMEFVVDGERFRHLPLKQWRMLNDVTHGASARLSNFTWKLDDPKRATHYFMAMCYLLEWTVHTLLGMPAALWEIDRDCPDAHQWQHERQKRRRAAGQGFSQISCGRRTDVMRP